jgi:hypothetical protein
MLGAESEDGALVSPCQNIDVVSRIRSDYIFVYLFDFSLSICLTSPLFIVTAELLTPTVINIYI